MTMRIGRFWWGHAPALRLRRLFTDFPKHTCRCIGTDKWVLILMRNADKSA